MDFEKPITKNKTEYEDEKTNSNNGHRREKRTQYGIWIPRNLKLQEVIQR